MNYFLMIFMILGLLGMAVSVSMVRKALKCRYWPQAIGKVKSCGIRNDRTSPGDDHGGMSNTPFVCYVYSVNGREHQGNRISVSEHGGSLQYAQNIIAKYNPTRNIVVYYNPDDPDDAVLDTKFSINLFLPFVVGALFFILSILFMTGTIGKKD